MKTNIKAIVAATFAMIITSVTNIQAKTPAVGQPVSVPSVISEVTNYSKTYDYYYISAKGKSHYFEYTVDKEGRVTSKTLYYHSDAGEWIPRCIWKVTYGKAINVISFAAWDSQKQEFSRNTESLAYSAVENPVLIALPK